MANSGDEAIKALDSEYDYISKYNLDPEGLITPPATITNISFSQDPKTGSWVKTESDGDNPMKLPSDTKNKQIDSRNKLINDLTDQSKVLDDQLISINTQINDKKNLIISTLTTAISAGCSYVPGDCSNVNGTGIGVGIGSTVFYDSASINVYSKIENYSADSPYDPVVNQSLSSSNSGTGYETVVSNNGGSSAYTTYKTIVPNPPIPPLIPPTANCQNLYDKITSLANDISSLRSQRNNVNLVDLNKVKDEKTDQEIRRWGLSVGDESINKRKSKITNSKTSIKNIK